MLFGQNSSVMKNYHSNFYSAGIDRWPCAEGFYFFLSISHIHAEYHWESDHHHIYICGLPPENASVIFLTKFLLPRDLIHNCLYSQIPVKHCNGWQCHYLQCLCQPSVFYWPLCNNICFFSWLPCLMTAMWPSANLCIIWPSWVAKSARDLFFALDWLNYWS